MAKIQEPEILAQEPEEQALNLTNAFGPKAADLEGVFANLDFEVSEEPIPDSLQTAHGREGFFADLLSNVHNLTDFVDEIAWQGYAGHEGAYSQIRDMADLSSGKLPVQMEQLGMATDENMKARYSQTLSANTASGKRMEHRQKFDTLDLNTPGKETFEAPEMPVIGSSIEDMDIAMQAIVEQLALKGVPESDINMAMAASLQNPQDGIEELYDLADKNDVHLTEYILDTDRAMVQVLADEGMDNLRKPLDDVDAPALAIKEPEYIYDDGMNGPRQGGLTFG